MMKRIISGCLGLLLLCALCAEATVTIIPEGSRGSGVRYLQQELKSLGYFDGEPDGIYGLATGMAVGTYAAAKGLATDANVGLDVIEALRQDLSVSSINKGDAGTSAYAVQKVLYDMGFLEAEPDGKFGDQSKQAARQYMQFVSDSAVSYMQQQEDTRVAEVQATAEPDDMPVAVDVKLITPDNVVTDGTVTSDWFEFMMSDSSRSGKDIDSSSDKEDVKRLQRRLRALGYTADTRIDGVFGGNTVRVLKYFQHLNGLQETGICDQATQAVLFTDAARKSDQYVAPYAAYVDTANSKVHIFEWTGAGYTKEVKTFICSTGAKNTPTVKGTFQAIGQISPWYYMPHSSVWVRNAFQIQGNYFFHSVLFHSKGSNNPTASSVRNLGSNVSHGCIRLSVEDSQWLYDNCTPGMTVVIE